MDIMEEGLTVRTPVYVITEGHEPPFFTRFFEWVPGKANMHGNSFERKLASLKEKTIGKKGSSGSPWRSHSKDNSSRRRSVNSNGSERGVSPCSSEKISSLSSAEDRGSSSNSTPVVKKLFSENASDGSIGEESSSNSDISKENQLGGISLDLSLESLALSYEQLRVDAQEPVTDIDATRREAYLTEKQFGERFKMTKFEFYALPKWKQNKLKMSLHLF